VSGGLEQARGHLAAAVAELEAACRAWGLWADEVRERAEQRLGTGPGDPRVRCEPEYARAGAPRLRLRLSFVADRLPAL
jgi:hypothetical protein